MKILFIKFNSALADIKCLADNDSNYTLYIRHRFKAHGEQLMHYTGFIGLRILCIHAKTTDLEAMYGH